MCTCPHLHLLSMQRINTSFLPALMRAQPTAQLNRKHATLLHTHTQAGFRSEALHTHRQGNGKGLRGATSSAISSALWRLSSACALVRYPWSGTTTPASPWP